MSVNIRNYVSSDHIESIGEIAKSQSAIIQALSLENSKLEREIERLNNIINEALGIANERFNYYHHTNKKEILEDWENIFNVLLRRDNE